jgi:hypothetical protein
MKKRTNRKRKLKRNNKRKTRKFSKKYNSRGGSLFWRTNSGSKKYNSRGSSKQSEGPTPLSEGPTPLSEGSTPIVMEPTNYGYNLYEGPTPIVMDPIILFKSKTDTDEQCHHIKQLMSDNKTFVRIPQSIEHLTNNDFKGLHNPEGILCGYSSLLIPGWYETYISGRPAELYIKDTDDDDKIDNGCGFENYIWPADALGHIETKNGNKKTTVAMYDSIMGLYYQGILLSSFMGYIYDPKNNILTSEEKNTYVKYYNNRHLSTPIFANNYNQNVDDKNMICELIKSCFKTYSQFVKFVTTIQRHKTLALQWAALDQNYEDGELVSYENSQRLCMHSFYTETLLPENRKLVGLYIHSRNRNRRYTTDTDYETYKAAAIKTARELNLTLYSLEERSLSVPP